MFKINFSLENEYFQTLQDRMSFFTDFLKFLSPNPGFCTFLIKNEKLQNVKPGKTIRIVFGNLIHKNSSKWTHFYEKGPLFPARWHGFLPQMDHKNTNLHPENRANGFAGF